MAVRFSWLAILWVAACGGEQAQDPDPAPAPRPVVSNPGGDPSDSVPPPVLDDIDEGPDWLRGAVPEDLPAHTYSLGIGLHSDPEIAQAQAEQTLGAALLGPQAERPDDVPPAFDVERDVARRATLDDGRTAVLLAVSKPIFALRLQTWLDNPPATETTDASTPTGMLAAAMAFYDFQARLAFGCLRQRTIVGSECELPDTTMARRQVAAIAKSVRIEPALLGGIPYRPGGAALQPIRVRVRWRNAAGEQVPWPLLALDFTAADGSLGSGETAAVTDAEGYAEVPFAQNPTADTRITVSLRREDLLGSLAEVWPPVAASFEMRPVTLGSGRVAVFIRDTILDEALDGSPASAAAVRTLEDRGYAAAQALDPVLARPLLTARGPDLVAALRAAAIASYGAVDQVVIGDARSDFASRMGSRSIWHEAVGVITVYDVWSGEQIGAIERTTRARGIGDHNAGRKALRDLGKLIGEAVDELLRTRAAEPGWEG